MKFFFLTVLTGLSLASCTSHLRHDVNHKESGARKFASQEEQLQEFSSQKEIEEFLNLNDCSIKVFDSKKEKLLYTRFLMNEISEGKKDKIQTNTYLQESKDNTGAMITNIDVAPSVDDPFAEEIRIGLYIDKQPLNFKRPLFNAVYVNNSMDLFRENSKMWNSVPTLLGVDFEFMLTRSERYYVFRCDAGK